MRQLRLLIIAIAAIFVLALAVSALVNKPPLAPGDDDIIIKGGSMEIQCGRNHKIDNAGCLNLDDGATGKFKHKQGNKHITRVQVKNSNNIVVFDSNNLNTNDRLGATPQVVITYEPTNVNGGN